MTGEIPRRENSPRSSTELEAILESELQYRSALNADARRKLYKFADPPRNIWREIAQKMALSGDETILDVATGSGLFLEILRDSLGHKGQMLGIDKYGQQFLKSWQRINKKDPYGPISFQRGDAHSIHFADNTFDAASELFFLYHSYDAELAAAELRRVVKPGGIIAISSRDEQNMEGLWNLAHIGSDAIGATQQRSFYNRCDIERTRKILESMFEVVDSDIQDSPLKIPRDERKKATQEKAGDNRGWKKYRAAFLSLSDSMLDKQTGLPLFHQDKETGIYIFQSKIDLLAKFADKVVKSLFDEEVTHREQTTGEGYKLDRVRQGYFIVRNSYK